MTEEIMTKENQIRLPEKIILHGRNLEGLLYLFSASSDEGIFAEISLDLLRCNDLAFVILNAGENLRKSENIDTAKPPSIGSIFDGTLKTLTEDEENDYMNSYHVNQQKEFVDNLYSVKEFEMLYSKSLVLGMIQIAFEAILKKLILALDPKDPMSNPKTNIVKSLINTLDAKIKNQNVVNGIITKKNPHDKNFWKVINLMIDIRNKFVHGNWEQLRNDVNLVNPVDFFNAISKLLMRYEETFNRLNLLKPT